MMLRPRSVTVKPLPQRVDRHMERAFLHEIGKALNTERPSIVLDCAPVRDMNSTAIHLLLCCLEEALKRHGDVRLAGLSSQGRDALHTWGVDDLFRMFETTEMAVESFRRRTAFMPASVSISAALASEHAA